MQKRKKVKSIVISVTAVVAAAALGLGLWRYFRKSNVAPVKVYDFYSVGMDSYWGDSKETYGPVSTDRIQTVFLSSTQTVSEVLVKEGDTVKKGDVLMRFDTTLNDLSLERKRLEVEKLKVDLQNAYDRLAEINNMKPMVIPDPTQPTDPVAPDQGTPISGHYQLLGGNQAVGTAENPLICWLNSSVGIEDTLLAQLRQAAQDRQAALTPTQPTQPTETTEAPAAQAAEDETTAPSGTTEPTTAPTDPSTDPTQPSPDPTEPSTDPTEPSTDPTQPTEPEKPEVQDFYVVFKVTEENMSKGANLTWQGLHVFTNGNSFVFQFFDASGVKDPVEDTPVEPTEPDIDIGSGYTAAQIAQMRTEQEKTIRDTQFQIKTAENAYKIMQKEMDSGEITADFDGTVVSLTTEEDAKINSTPFLKVSGGGSFYIQCTIGEWDRETVKIGQEVTINDWRSGSVITGTVQSIGDYPSTDNGYMGDSNPNISYYPMTVYVDGSADLQEGNYVDVQYSEGGETGGIYLQTAFLRSENGTSYVYVAGADGKLEKRTVTTGKVLWGGEYYEIRSGLSVTDQIAFPYGKNVVAGAPTESGDLSELYGY